MIKIYTVFCKLLAVVALLLANSSILATDDVIAIETVLNPNEIAMIDWLAQRETAMLDELAMHVNINTGTANIAGINQYRDKIDAELSQLGFKTEQHRSASQPILDCRGGQIEFANHLVATRRGNSANRILLNGHLDTVFPKHDEFQSLKIDADGGLHGPGVADMKGGIVIMLNALRALDQFGLLKDVNITVLLNSDEEIGSLGSRALIVDLAKQHDIGLVFESSFENRVVRARKGLGQARIKVVGRESHAGSNHSDGVSANLELAHKIIDIEKLTNYEKNTTVNVGVMSGGEKRNTVAGCADAYIDMRYPSQADGEALKNNLLEVASKASIVNDRYANLPTIESWAVLHRPAKEQNPTVDELIAKAMGLSIIIGEPIVGTRYSGGGTDGSIAQNVGLPTMDSLGIDGAGAHSSRETSSVQSLMARTKLAAVLIARLIVEQ